MRDGAQRAREHGEGLGDVLRFGIIGQRIDGFSGVGKFLGFGRVTVPGGGRIDRAVGPGDPGGLKQGVSGMILDCFAAAELQPSPTEAAADESAAFLDVFLNPLAIFRVFERTGIENEDVEFSEAVELGFFGSKACRLQFTGQTVGAFPEPDRGLSAFLFSRGPDECVLPKTGRVFAGRFQVAVVSKHHGASLSPASSGDERFDGVPAFSDDDRKCFLAPHHQRARAAGFIDGRDAISQGRNVVGNRLGDGRGTRGQPEDGEEEKGSWGHS